LRVAAVRHHHPPIVTGIAAAIAALLDHGIPGANEIEVKIIIERYVEGIRRVDEQERIPVRRRLGDYFGANIATGARSFSTTNC
jgi:hypothetical protein